MVEPELIVLAAGLLFVLGYLIINQWILRILMLIGTALYIWYYATAAAEPLWAAMWMSTATGCANVIGLMFLWFRRSHAAIPHKHRDIYPSFDLLPPGDFRSIILCAKRHVLEDEIEATREGAPVQTLYYILKGSAQAEKKGQSFPLPDNIFLGEIGCLTGVPASATTWIAAGSEILEWDVAQVRRKSERSVRFKLALEAMISHDLAAKVARAGSPAAVASPSSRVA
ncbi:cyclic nucleotide-binding domain-containing protein [Ovoidimarina sediminis]|uniref:cyclic nucleotide-binding domain-containing protein n=1 Tax=Ovoidimarina sediminis TaxID=3079856 RepID=UPI00290B3D25|nr:cyclic nucleotide-binding domain-containing protein [Rhodophyticola sp. MJ-SS7]MDU8943110.1 cyclic nucleotide-binding domain-containing protein [Rhodophyticola sp. MJ-SS7]